MKPGWLFTALALSGLAGWAWRSSVPTTAGSGPVNPTEGSSLKPAAKPLPREPQGLLADLARMAQNASLVELQALLPEVMRWQDDSQRTAGRRLLFECMTALDGPAALAWARGKPEGDKGAFADVLRAWGTTDGKAALEAAEELVPPQVAAEARVTLLFHLAARQPALVFEHTKDAPGKVGAATYTLAMQTLAKQDPAAARVVYEALPAKVRAPLLGPLAEGWARADAPAALTWAKALPEPDRQWAIFGIATAKGPSDPALILREANAYLEGPDGPRTAPAWVLKAIARGLAQQDPEKAVSWVRAHSEGAETSKALALEVLPIVVSQGGADAAVRLVKLLGPDDDEAMEEGVEAFLKNWQPADAAAQVTALSNITHTPSRTSLLNNLSDVWVMQDAAGALSALKGFTDQKSIHCLAGALGRFLSESYNLEGFQQTVPYLNPKFKTAFCNSMAIMLAWEDPATAAGFAASLNPGSEERAEAFAGIGSYWGSQEPQAALPWIASLPEADQARAAQWALKNWSENDPLAASQYVQSLPPGKLRDTGAAMLAVNLQRQEPDSAFIWLQSVQDATVREDIYPALMRHWARFDPPAARQSLEDANIGEELRASLRAEFNVFHSSQQ